MVINSESLFDFLNSNPSEQDCIKYLEKIVWKEKVVSPHDPTSEVYPCANNRYKCKNTGKTFTAKSLTIFRNSNLPLKKWFLALYLFAPQEISSRKLAKKLKITPKSAWYVEHRLRLAFKNPIFEIMLENTVEIDETFIGGKNKNRHWDKKVPHCQGRNWKDKIPVLGMLERNGNLIVKVIPNTQQKTLEPIIRANVKEGSTIYSDDWYRHSNLFQSFNHQWVNHSAKQYTKGDISVNAIESFWNFPKRGIYGTYYHISRKHSQKYMDEFAFRFNTRKYGEGERFDLVLASVVGKQMTYQQLISP